MDRKTIMIANVLVTGLSAILQAVLTSQAQQMRIEEAVKNYMENMAK